jgi:hydroxyacylglutathione hydrolase
MNNPLRNYNYIIACPISNQAIILDPFDAQACLAVVKEQGLSVAFVINTHEHWDHVQGNAEVVEETNALVIAHAHAKGKIPNVDRFVVGGDCIKLGHLNLTVLNTPGHTHAHLSLLESKHKALFSGDILFNACAGNCFNGGDVDVMYETFRDEIGQVPDDVLLYPGHDYIETNLKFSLSREPNNIAAKTLLARVKQQTPETRLQTTLGEERTINPFLRLNETAIRDQLTEDTQVIIENSRAAFVQLRKLRDHW